MLLAAFTLIFNWVNSNGEYMLGRLVKEDATRQPSAGALAVDAIGQAHQAFWRFLLHVNVLGVFQRWSFVVSARIIKYFGFQNRVSLIMPAICTRHDPLLNYLAADARWRHSALKRSPRTPPTTPLNIPTRQMFGCCDGGHESTKAKQAVDTFFVRMGDVSSALLVYVGMCHFVGAMTAAASNALLVVIWLGLAVVIVRENRRFAAEAASRSPELRWIVILEALDAHDLRDPSCRGRRGAREVGPSPGRS